MKPKNAYRTVGRAGERFVVKVLQDRGFYIEATNYRYRALGEIDIFASKDNCLYSIEVKTLVNMNPFTYQAKIDDRKVSRIVKLSEVYMKQILCNKIGNIRYFIAFVQILTESHPFRYRCTFIPL